MQRGGADDAHATSVLLFLERVLNARIPAWEYRDGDDSPPSDLSQPTDREQKPEAFVAETLLGVPHARP